MVHGIPWVEPVAETLGALGAQHAWVVHGDGYDEITTTGETRVAELSGGKLRTFSLSPETVGLQRHGKNDLKGGDAAFNATALRAVLGGAQGAYRDTVLLNAGAGLVVAGKAAGIDEGVRLAALALDEGAAATTLERLVEISNE